MTVNVVPRDEARDAYREASGCSRGDIVARIQALNDKFGQLDREARGADGAFDVANIASVEGDTTAKHRAVMSIHAQLTGFKEALGERLAMQRASDRLRASGDAIPDFETDVDFGAALGSARRRVSDDVRRARDLAGAENYGTARGLRQWEVDGGLNGALYNAVLTTGTGPAPIPEWREEIVLRPEGALEGVIGAYGAGRTTSASIRYRREETIGDAAARAEAAASVDLNPTFTTVTANVEDVAGHVLITKEELEDSARVESYLDRRVPQRVRRALARQVTVGSGATPNLQGVVGLAGIQGIDTAKVGATKVIGSKNLEIGRAIGLIATKTEGEAMATHVMMEGATLYGMVLETDADGRFLHGPPNAAMMLRSWGLPIVHNPFLDAAATGGEKSAFAMVGDFANQAELAIRDGMVGVDVGWINDQFIRGELTIRANIRAAALYYQALAFCAIYTPAEVGPWT